VTSRAFSPASRNLILMRSSSAISRTYEVYRWRDSNPHDPFGSTDFKFAAHPLLKPVRVDECQESVKVATYGARQTKVAATAVAKDKDWKNRDG
jgi:hypothetical protein